MSTFTLILNADNAAFDGNASGEIARILTEVADKIRAEGGAAFDGGVIRLRDFNGNRVGFATMEAA